EIAELSFAGNGEDALDMIKADFYNLIIMDIGLPGISGLEAVGEIRKLGSYKSVPVIAVSAYAMVGDRETFLSRGCSHYISKPFSFSELKEVVNKLLKDHNDMKSKL
ncbi:MAG: response regulator, partial [Bacteroidetes bacterium]|nr:response regulator [Bacteroidota bacterium]